LCGFTNTKTFRAKSGSHDALVVQKVTLPLPDIGENSHKYRVFTN
jgi:hypothetical protein